VQERPSTTARTLALLTGTAGIVLIGIAMMSLSPRGGQVPAVQGAADAADSGSVVLTTLASIKSREFAIEPIPLVTPLDRDGLAVAPSRTIRQVLTEQEATDAAATQRSGTFGNPFTITVRLGDGTTRTAVVIDAGVGNDLALVEILAAQDPEDQPYGHPVALLMPSPRELVTVLTDVPVTVKFSEVSSLGVADGTAVVNSDGQLVGLCWQEAASAGSGFIPIDSMYAGATAPTPQPSRP
jgi:hypothetical protein